MNNIDLHTHSISSIDGQYTPKQLIDIALESNVKYLAICDHDSVNSIPAAVEYAKDKDITFIPGIELSAIVDDSPIHITAYNIDYNHPGFKQRWQYIKDSNFAWGQKLIKKALDYGFKFNPDEVYRIRDDHQICEELLAEVIYADHRNDDDERLIEFRPGGKFSNNPPFNFYKELTTPGKPLYVQYETDMPIDQASKLIHDAGGKMFLAHPYHNIKYSKELLNKIISYGLDGIEVFSSYHDAQVIEYYYQEAKKNNLYMSVGSDYHGKSKPSIKMCSIDYDPQELEKTLNFILNK